MSLTKQQLAEALLSRFKGVPNVDETDIDAWIERSMMEHGYRADQLVADEDQLMILLYAEWDGTQQIALRTAHYFNYDDSEESVDKRMVSQSYRIMATRLQKEYEKSKSRSGGARMTFTKRGDR